jgi:hypothetical protein
MRSKKICLWNNPSCVSRTCEKKSGSLVNVMQLCL